MVNQTIDPHHFIRRARQVKAQIPIILSQWGLISKFKRWRLAKDPQTGTVVLFGVLDNKYISTHSTTPFSNYFDARLLHDMEKELHVPVIPSANDGLRYAFILEKGLTGALTAPKETLFEHLETVEPSPSQIPVALVEIHIAPPPKPYFSILVDEHTVIHQRLDRFLKIAEALEVLNNENPAPPPDILLLDETEFERQLAEYEANRSINHR
jgi:hypothetical protein